MKDEKVEPKDCDLFLSVRKLVNTFINWFDEWSDWALSDIWLINSVDFVEGVVSCWFSWDSPSYDFDMTVNFYDDEDCYLVVDMRQPLIVSFHSEIENRIAEKLIEKMRKVYTFYADNEDKVKQNKRAMLRKIFQFMRGSDEE